MAKQNDVKIIYDPSLMMSSNIGNPGLQADHITLTNQTSLSHYLTVQKKLLNGEYECANLATETGTIDTCKEIWGEYSPWVKQVVIVGIGGADQTAKMLYNAFGENPSGEDRADIPKVEFLGSCIDPDEVGRVRAFVNGHEKETAVVVLSKSGTTVETGAGYLTLREQMQGCLGSEWKNHFLFATDKEEGIFIKEVKAEELRHISTSSVGDRFAPLSVLGLLPAEIFRMNSSKFLKGAADMFAHLGGVKQEENIAWNIALYQKMFQDIHKINSAVSMIYISRLEQFNMWLRQLWSESLGKKGKGIVIDPAMGPRDQHSTLQQYNDGKWISSFLFMTQRTFDKDVILPVGIGVGELSHLSEKSLTEATNASARNTQLTLKGNGRPSAHLEIETLNEETFGALVALYEMIVIYLGELFELKNVFDQPGVTESRGFIDASMKRPGSEPAQQKLALIEAGIQKSSIAYP